MAVSGRPRKTILAFERNRGTPEAPPDYPHPRPQTVPEELQNGRGFGYVVAFRPHGAGTWMLTVLASADACRYVFRNESVRPFAPFEVRVGTYNSKGEGPFSPVTVVYSAEEGAGPAAGTGPRGAGGVQVPGHAGAGPHARRREASPDVENGRRRNRGWLCATRLHAGPQVSCG